MATASKSIRSSSVRKSKGKQPNEKRQKLMDLSQVAKERKKIMMAKAQSDAEAFAIAALSVNDIVLSMYEDENPGAKEWQTFKQWADKGYKVKKGSSAFYIWAKPIKDANKSTIETPEGAKEHEDNYKYWPMCGLFNNLQVEKRDEKPTAAEEVNETKEEPATASKTEKREEQTIAETKEEKENEIVESPFVCENYQDKQEGKRERYEERGAKAEQLAQTHYSQGHKMAEVIPFGQPILVGHHSEKGDRAYRSKIVRQFDKSMEAGKKAEHYNKKAETVGKGGIASDDPEALSKLKEKLRKKEELQSLMKEANKALKKDDDEALQKLGLKEHQIKMLKEPDFAGRPGFPSYKLTNNGAEIRRLKKRIEGLEKLYNSKPVEFENDDFKLYVDDGRVHVEFFDGKPSEEVRTLLNKTYSFKFSRYSGTWTRKATQNAVFLASGLIDSLKENENIYS